MKFKNLLIFFILLGGSILIYNFTLKKDQIAYDYNQLDNAPEVKNEDTISLFFSLIDQNKIEEALDMMSSKMRMDEKAWEEHFNHIYVAKINDIQPHNKENWTDEEEIYKVDLNIIVDNETSEFPIPYYGWEEESNIRWISLLKEQNTWKINSISTGP